MSQSLLIIAAERGLGLGLAKDLCDRGWNVVGTARSGADISELKRVGASDPTGSAGSPC
jgi:NAD(P)-dependent dehydrogenase (short-subunit alcohol dehydrogenase family)